MTNHKEQFKSWLIKKHGEIGTPGSFIQAIDILNKKLRKEIFNLNFPLDLSKESSNNNYFFTTLGTLK